jgi:hypothetical protein
MKIATSFLAALLFIGTLGAINTATGQDGIIYDQEVTPESYCHLKFPAITDPSLAGDHPVLKDSGDVIDFYGPCDENPVGKDQVMSQRMQNRRHWVSEYYAN